MNNIIKGLYVEIISMCNCKCTYCYNKDNWENQNIFDVNLFSKILSECQTNNISSISVSGGEPFLHPQLLELINISIKKHINLNIITNLTIYNKYVYAAISKYSIPLQVTIDGGVDQIHDYTRGINSFNKTIKNFEKLTEHNYNGFLTIRMNLHKRNYQHIEDVVRLSKTLNCNSLHLSLLNKVGGATEFVDFIETNDREMLEQIHETSVALQKKYNINIIFEGLNPSLGCPYYGSDNIECGLRVSSDGYVYPCQLFSDKIFNIGNIKYNSLAEIINGLKMEKFLTLLSLRKTFIKECSECAYQGMCATGCPAEAYNNNGNIFSNAGKCDGNKMVLNSFIKHEISKTSG